MQNRVLPMAMETMISGGQAGAAAPLLAERADDRRLAYARALLKQAQGENETALAMFDALAKLGSVRTTTTLAPPRRARLRLRLAMGNWTTKLRGGR